MNERVKNEERELIYNYIIEYLFRFPAHPRGAGEAFQMNNLTIVIRKERIF